MEKVRTQIQLERRQYERLKEEAFRNNQSLSQTIRSMIDRGFEAEAGKRTKDTATAFSFIGCISDDKKDVAECHDAYLDEALGGKLRK
ncbi:MAG: hypothetical protein RDV48_07120 [Candidatus Eremiobacteraeota bacterium]|nr:hypothetical protein [Candidatus Eremiobacteraeota bacterium]